MGEAVQTMPRRLLGGELKRLRVAAGKSQEEVANVIGKVRTRIIKLEDGRSNLTSDELKKVLDFLDASPADCTKVLAMGVEARQRQPKRAYVDLLPGAYRRLADLETLATGISYYDQGVFPGLLQIAEYTEAQMATGDGIWWMSSYQERVNRVAFRLERQRLVYEADPPKQLEFIFTDNALTTPVGSPDVMRRQIEHVLRITAENSNITVRLLSATAPNNPAPQGALILLSFDKRTPCVGVLPVAYGPATYLDGPSDTDALARCINRLRDLAFGGEESRKLLEEALERI